MYKFKKITLLAAAAVLLLTGGAAAGGTAAYLSASPGSAVNIITSGSVSISLTEDQWKPDAAQNLHPGQSAPKNPVISNTGKNSAFVFLEVKVPARTLHLVGTDGKKTPADRHDLFAFSADTGHWSLIETKKENENTCYVYGYRQILNPGASTTALFHQVTAVNYLEGDLNAEEKFQILVGAKAIQTNVDTVGGSLPEIYAEFLKQTAADQKQGGAK